MTLEAATKITPTSESSLLVSYLSPESKSLAGPAPQVTRIAVAYLPRPYRLHALSNISYIWLRARLDIGIEAKTVYGIQTRLIVDTGPASIHVLPT